jgi:hypothetical protein
MELGSITANQLLYILAVAVGVWAIVYLIQNSTIPEVIKTAIYLFMAILILFWIF